MFSGGRVETMGASPAVPTCSRKSAYIKILEQPASKALRFRYECEGRSAGSIPGVNSTADTKTFPSIKIEGYKGRAVVVVSCVTRDPPHRPHPHNLVGKEACRKGVCTVEMACESMITSFPNLGIQCVKKKDIDEALRVRQEIRVDPFRTGFAHKATPSSIDLNAVRLCFQAFLEGAEKGKFTVPLSPVVSDTIYDKKAMSDLLICKLSDCCCTVSGGKEMILLCEKVAKDDIRVRFFEECDGRVAWEGFGDFQPNQVHKQVAISFRVPQYRCLEVDQPVKVFIQLVRPSDGATSDAVPFEYLPLDSDPKSKRKRIYANHPSAHALRHLQRDTDQNGATRHQPLQGFNVHPIKSEPGEQGPSLYQVAPGGGIPASGFPPIYRFGQSMPSPHPIPLEPYRHQPSPGRTPSPMECSPAMVGGMRYNILPTQFAVPSQQFQSTQQYQYMMEQQTTANRPNVQQSGSAVFPHVNTAGVEGAAVAGPSNVLTTDNRQCSFELSALNQLNSNDLATFSTVDDNLLQNLSSNLSLSDIRVSQTEGERPAESGAACVVGGNGNNLTDSFTRLTKSTIQELCSLNNMYDHKTDNNG